MRHLHRPLLLHRRLHKRRLLVEALEARMLLYAEGLPWAAPNLTISFAPDGTNVAGYESSLFAKFDSLATSSDWQAAIVQGFDTWAQHAATSVSTTADSGDAFGTPGPTQADSRFGDVRVAAVPMADDIIAMSVPHDEVISGTWAGDILFNSNVDLNTLDEIFAIAVHEAGHVFGLGHSTDPNSPMYLHGIAPATTPTAEDINNLQRLYGVAEPQGGSDGGADQGGGDEQEREHEREHQDDELTAANGLMLSANFQGAIRYDAAGQIFDATDVDFYQLAPISDEFEKADVLTVTVRAKTPEGLIPTATILNAGGQVVESIVLTNANGEFILQAKDADPRMVHFVEVKAADSTGAHATGTYDFVATFGTRETVLDRIAKGTLKAEEPARSSVLHVRETRLVHFVLAADPVETVNDSIAWTVIYDSGGNPVFRAAAKPGESRSANTLLLTPGDYSIQFRRQSPVGTDEIEIDYRLLARSVSLPVGPDLIDPTAVPILPCSDPASDPVYCSSDDVVIVDPLILPDPTPITLPAPVVTIPSPWLDSGFWHWDGVAPPNDLPAPIGTASSPATSPTTSWQNAEQPQDVNADGSVSPLDALLVINSLNERGTQRLPNEHPAGSPFLDVNNDGFVAPVDALLVINELNQSGGVAAEGKVNDRFQVVAPVNIPKVSSASTAELRTTSPAQSEKMPTAVPAGDNVETSALTKSLPARKTKDALSLDEAIQLIAADLLETHLALLA